MYIRRGPEKENADELAWNMEFCRPCRGALFLLSSWYTRKELALRTAWLYSGSLLSGAFTGLIAAGIQNGLNGARGIAPWRYVSATSAIYELGAAPNLACHLYSRFAGGSSSSKRV